MGGPLLVGGLGPWAPSAPRNPGLARILVGLEVAMVTLVLAVAHSLTVADVKTVSSEISIGHSDSSNY